MELQRPDHLSALWRDPMLLGLIAVIVAIALGVGWIVQRDQPTPTPVAPIVVSSCKVATCSITDDGTGGVKDVTPRP